MHFKNHIPNKVLIIVGVLLVAAAVSFGYWLAQFNDLEVAPSPAEQYTVFHAATSTPTPTPTPTPTKKPAAKK